MSKVFYCKRCLYPSNAKPTIVFDAEGICSGCRYIESRKDINWEEKQFELYNLLNEYKIKARKENKIYDCLIPISGGKDSHWQVYVAKKLFNMTPLCVSYNHGLNSKVGLRNLENLIAKFDVDLIRFTTNPQAVRRLTRYGFKKMGDPTYYYHSSIMSWPMQIAVKYKIPLIIWGESGFSELIGMFNQSDMHEFTKKQRTEHSMRGVDVKDILKDPLAKEERITLKDLVPFIYPSEEDVEQLGLRGIYLSNYMNWKAKEQTEKMIEKYDFSTAESFDRTFNIYSKIDDICANGVHDYCKYLKFGYGRATDDASTEIRHGRMTREEGVAMVLRHDHKEPQDLEWWLDFAGFSRKEFYDIIEPFRDLNIWRKERFGWFKNINFKDFWINEPTIKYKDFKYYEYKKNYKEKGYNKNYRWV